MRRSIEAFFTREVEFHFGDCETAGKIGEEGESAVEESHDIYESYLGVSKEIEQGDIMCLPYSRLFSNP